MLMRMWTKRITYPLLLGVQICTGIMENTCQAMFIAALLIISRDGKQLACPSTEELIKKIFYTYTTDY